MESYKHRHSNKLVGSLPVIHLTVFVSMLLSLPINHPTA